MTITVQGEVTWWLLTDSTQGLAKLVKVGKEAIEPPIPTAFGVGTQAVSPGGRLLFSHKVTSDSLCPTFGMSFTVSRGQGVWVRVRKRR